jgi:protein BCP1
MVKKRIRDPEVLEEAPPAKSGADDNGSDDV